MSSSGLRIGSSTLRATAFNPKKSKRPALAGRWFSVQSPAEETQSIRLPNTDSIEELARFWDTHDLTDFESDLEEVRKPVFVRAQGISLSIQLQPEEAQRLRQVARSKGVTQTAVLRQWIAERLRKSSAAGRGPNKALLRTRQEAARR